MTAQLSFGAAGCSAREVHAAVSLTEASFAVVVLSVIVPVATEKPCAQEARLIEKHYAASNLASVTPITQAITAPNHCG